MTHRKAVFVDVDGTLLDERGHIPSSAVEAIVQAQAGGHLVFLATGRSVCELWPELVDLGFDGLVGASGSYVEVDGEVLFERYLSSGQIAHVAEWFSGGTGNYFLQASDGNYASEVSRSRVRRRLEEELDRHRGRLQLRRPVEARGGPG